MKKYHYAKALVVPIAVSYFLHTLYWINRSIRYNYFSLTQPNSDVGNIIPGFFGGNWILAFGLFFLMGVGALAIRFIGAINAVVASYLVWRRGTNALRSVKGKIANALLCEGVYWGLFIIPIGSLNFRFAIAVVGGVSAITLNFLTLSYSLQISLIAPFLIALSMRIRRNNYDLGMIVRSKLFWLASIFYVVALWENYTIRWLELVAYHGLEALLIESAYIGLLNSAVNLFLAVIFAVIAALPVLKGRGGPVLKWVSLSLIFLGLHFLIHILYTAYTGVLSGALDYRLKFMLLSDVWPVTALGLGLYLFTKKNRQYTS